MRISVDLNRCQSYGQCCFAAPDVFHFHNGEALEYDPAPGEARRWDVVRAAKACPVQAIQIGLDDEEEEGLQREETHSRSYQWHARPPLARCRGGRTRWRLRFAQSRSCLPGICSPGDQAQACSGRWRRLYRL